MVLLESVLVNEDAVIVWGDSPVLRMIILVGEVLLVVREEGIELQALLEVLNCFQASDLLQEIKISIHVDACSDQSVPVDALQFHV